MIKRATLCLVWVSSISGLQAATTFLWQDQVDQVEKRLSARAQVAPPQFRGGRIGHARIDGTDLCMPAYGYKDARIRGQTDALRALLDVLEDWTRIFVEDQELNELFQLFTYRKIFPAGCAVSCARPYQSGNESAFAGCDRGEIRWLPNGGNKDCVHQPIQDILTQYGDATKWPLVHKATKEWLAHPQISEERANELLDRELERRRRMTEQAGSKLRNVPKEIENASAVKLLEYLESKGCVVLSFKHFKPDSIADRPFPREYSLRYKASVGSRQARSLDECYCLAFECIEFLQNQLEPLQDRLNKRPADLKPVDFDNWLRGHRIPIRLSINIPAPNDGGGEGTPVVVSINVDEIIVHCIPPYANPERQTMKNFSYWKQSEKWNLLEGFPKTKELMEAYKAFHCPKGWPKGQEPTAGVQ